MCILASIVADWVLMQPLTEYIGLVVSPTQPSKICKVAHIFETLQQCIGLLKEWYGSIKKSAEYNASTK